MELVNKQAIINGLLIHYSIVNDVAPDYTMIFLHGWRSNRAAWNTTISNLQITKKISIVTIDLPGFGNSQVPNVPFGVTDYANIIEEFVRKFDLKNIIIIGHSFGGRIGIKLANQCDIKLLLLVDSAGIAKKSISKSIKLVIAKCVSPMFNLNFLKPLRKRIYKFIGSEDYTATPYLKETFVKIINEDLRDDIKRIQNPTVIIWGENDSETLVSMAYEMKSLIHNSKLYIIKGAGHYVFLDQPNEFTTILNNTLNELF